jgi:hypothetical protein
MIFDFENGTLQDDRLHFLLGLLEELLVVSFTPEGTHRSLRFAKKDWILLQSR